MPRKNGPGLLITFEGGEATGKSTQAALLGGQLRRAGIPFVSLREPGSTVLGLHLREYLKGNGPMVPEAELLLFGAARAQMVSERLLPALEQGLVVISDRYADSTTAYQGGGRGQEREFLDAMRRYATQGVEPDLTVLLDADTEATGKRATGPQMSLLEQQAEVRVDLDHERRYEKEKRAFHRRVREAYLRLAGEEPKRWLVLDALQSQEGLAGTIWERTRELLGAF